jgi:S-adenosylmethionine decarboxylase
MTSGDSRLTPSPTPNQAPFEGPEKLLEIWLDVKAPRGDGASDGVRRGLRAVPRAEWEAMLDIVRCKVLSVIEGHELDAYLLRWVALLIASQSKT